MSETTVTRSVEQQPYPDPRYAWYIVGLLLAAYIVSFIDRQIMALLVEPIKRDLGLSDSQMGLLLGPAFAMFYVTLGIPIGLMADRRSRKHIIGWGITIWCLMTAACGLARNFTQLFFARIGVGVGEATLTPSALSMISDYFPPKSRTRAVSVYMMGISLGSAIAYLVGGPVVQLITDSPPVALPVVGELYAWQTAFLVVGLPGLILAVLIFFVREPVRRGKAKLDGGASEDLTLGEGMAFLLKRWRPYGGLFLGMSVVTLMGYVGFWNPTLFARTWGWSIVEFSLAFGTILLIFGPLGAWLAGVLTTRFIEQGRIEGPYRAMLFGVLILVPTSIAFPLMPSGELALAVAAVMTIGGALPSAAGASALVYIAPNQVRATGTAIYWLVINMVGLFLGPTSVGWVTDYVFRDESKLYLSMAVIPAVFGTFSLIVMFWGYKHFRAAAEESRQWQETS